MTRGKWSTVFLSIPILALYLCVMFHNDKKDLQLLPEDPRAGVVTTAPLTSRRLKILETPGPARKEVEASYAPENVQETETMSERQRDVRERCADLLTLSERAQQPNSKEFLVSERYQLVWCNVFKAASSTWLDNFLRMAGYSGVIVRNHLSSPVELARKVYPRPTSEQLQTYLHQLNYTSFIIVRDPFQRLLSAYRDKLEPKNQSYYRSLKCQIKEKHGHRKSPHDCQPTFSEFVNHVIDEDAQGMQPNEHWAPYYRFCSPCQVEFDFILHFESLSVDEAVLLENVSGLAEVVKPQTLHSSHTDYARVTAEYFSQLTSRQLDGLLKIYLKDFRIFGYSETKYFDYINS
ncbi:carbohydrate sulfotransferase 11-like [Panulirus ornatus]|uniref:carbohydrate sulfotransferase 11-like n=1 Tax=Panulirus ornatus TaxID=150431 RepID=UPI003A8ACD5D